MKDIYTKKLTIRKNGHKPRVVHEGSENCLELSRTLGERLQQLVHPNLNKNRIKQSLEDIKHIDAFKYGQFIDIKKCFESCCVDSFIRFYSKQLSSDDKDLIKVIFNSDILNGKSSIKGFLRPGLYISDVIISIIMSDLYQLAENRNINFCSFVDDIRIYANSIDESNDFVRRVEDHLSQFKMKIHKEIGKKNSGILNLEQDGKLGERLGLQFRRINGVLITSLRPETKRRLVLRIKNIVIKVSCPELALEYISEVLYGNKDKEGFFNDIYPISLWSDNIDRKKVKISIVKIIKSKFKIGVNGIELHKLIREKYLERELFLN